MVADAFLEPFRLAPEGVHVHAPLQSVADNVLEAGARLREMRTILIVPAVRFVARDQTIVAVEDDEAFRNALDRVTQQRLGLLGAAKRLDDRGYVRRGAAVAAEAARGRSACC